MIFYFEVKKDLKNNKTSEYRSNKPKNRISSTEIFKISKGEGHLSSQQGAGLLHR
jgi:hypothetical protein